MTNQRPDDCGCCEGTTALTPPPIGNRPGLRSIAYRAGTYASFKRTMLTRLASTQELGGLRTREDDDFVIAYMDADAMVSDVLTFYRERHQNEAYLPTASEKSSVLQLARLIGYELAPGVAAEALLAFTLEEAPGSPTAVTLEPGLRVQSVPGPGEKSQTFETIEKLQVRTGWNALRPRMNSPQTIGADFSELYLEGIDSRVQPGDAILFLGRLTEARSSLQWSLGFVDNVELIDEPNHRESRTRVTMTTMLHPTRTDLSVRKVFALRQRAAIFGHNAPDPRLIPSAEGSLAHGDTWDYFGLPAKRISLDSLYPRIVRDSWVVLVQQSDSGAVEGAQLFKATEVSTASVARYGLSAKITRVHVEENVSPTFDRRRAAVFAESEELLLAQRPDATPVSGTSVDLGQTPEGLAVGRWVAVSGKERGDGPDLSELAQLSQVDGITLHFTAPLRRSYVRDTVVINANVVRAAHGETVQEVLGGGDPSQSFQRFPLKQPPLTYTTAPAANGRQSTLDIRVNDLAWKEVSTLYGRDPAERVFVPRWEDGGGTTVLFRGAPRGADNIRAIYRKGIGVEGNVKAGQLTTLLSRPLGLKAVTNPEDAAGGEDPESLADARRNAPTTVLTLDRVVSFRDYEGFVRTRAGFAKALATLTAEHGEPGVFLTVAGPNGAQPTSAQIANLGAALRKFGDPHTPFRIAMYRSAMFVLGGHVKVSTDYLPDAVLLSVTQSLRSHFSFDAREFGQPVWLSEVIAAVHGTPGVEAVDLDYLCRKEERQKLQTRLPADMPTGSNGAELLLLDPDLSGLDAM